jgi:peptidoglycan-associated lipoprotein
MKQQLRISLAICAVAAICGGCAKQQVLKQDQMIPPTTSSASAQTAKPAATAAKPATESNLPATAIKESQPEKQTQDAAQGNDAALKANLEKVFFDFDSYTLSKDARETLAKNAELLKKQKDAKVQIQGNCDELGSDEYNLALGEKRAKAAQQYLLGMGVEASRLSTISYGKEKPVVPGHDDSARAKNRRDEFVISSK